jgi:hypothetical protein
MGEVFNALETMNRTLKLGLSPSQLLGAEMGFKSAYAKVSNPNPTAGGVPQDPVELAQGYEMVVSFRPRAQKLTLAQLSSFATQTAASPQIRVDAKIAADISTAIQHASVATPNVRR